MENISHIPVVPDFKKARKLILGDELLLSFKPKDKCFDFRATKDIKALEAIENH